MLKVEIWESFDKADGCDHDTGTDFVSKFDPDRNARCVDGRRPGRRHGDRRVDDVEDLPGLVCSRCGREARTYISGVNVTMGDGCTRMASLDRDFSYTMDFFKAAADANEIIIIHVH